MAEVVAGWLASAAVGFACDKLKTAIAEQTSLAIHFKDDLRNMRDTMEDMNAVFKDAEKRSIKKESEQVRLWLKRLSRAALDISDMMDDSEDIEATPKMSGMFCCLTAPCKKQALANKMKKMREELEQINTACQKFNFTREGNTAASRQDQQRDDQRETTSRSEAKIILGRDGEKKKIIDILSGSHNEDGAMFLPIYGLGGMGKTTLAQLVFNDTEFKKRYQHHVWVYVSEVFDLKKIGTSIISQLPRVEDQQNLDDLQNIQVCLDKLLPGKKILIVLDDIWQNEVSELNKLKTMLKIDNNDSMVHVIVTTRSESIANRICANKAYMLQPLNDNLCWDIIKSCSGIKNKSNNGELERIGLEIAKKCGGVALAAQAIGYTLGSKDLNAWSEINNSGLWNESFGVDDPQHMKVLSSLMLSYERLQPILRLCFSYFAIFPKGYDIFEDDLIHQWVALDFIKKPSEGKEYIRQLLGMSFLQHSKLNSVLNGTRYTMHDLVHDLATSVTNDQLTTVDASQKSSSNTREHKYCRYALLTNYAGKAKLSNILPDKVRALHFASSSKLLASGEGSLSFAKCLRILDLSGCSGTTLLPYSIGQLNRLRCLIAPQVQDTELPESIAKLSKLQYINLQKSPLMSALPESFGELKNLVHLDMSLCFGISGLPESFGGLKSLTKLNMERCYKISSLPESFGRLESLTELDIRRSRITGLPESFGGLIRLTKLNMADCSRITSLPGSFGGLESLTKLDITVSRITSLPESFGGLKSLTELYMIGCSNITGLPESFGGLESLIYLNIDGCFQITGLPESFGGLISLTVLYMRRCSGVTSLSESFGGLESLTELYMNNCSAITSLPESFGRLKSLTKLYMIGCSRITGLPESFGGLISLTMLDMKCCSGVTSLPESFGGLESLTELYMNDCYGITILPESFGGLKSLTKLYIEGCYGISSLPESFGGLESLTELYMNNCFGITSLPESFGGLKSLTKLYMIGCSRITGLPESFGGLESLIHLNMDGCSQITGLPQLFGGLISLTVLNMRRCSGVTSLPESFGGLKSLTELYMNDCSGITSLPESFGGLKSLTELYMINCSEIICLPESFGGLKNLTKLNIEGCSRITGLPESFDGLRSSTELYMQGCYGITGIQNYLVN